MAINLEESLEDLKELSKDGTGNITLDGKPVSCEPIGKPFCIGNRTQIPMWIPEKANAYLMALAGHSKHPEDDPRRENLYLVQAYRV